MISNPKVPNPVSPGRGPLWWRLRVCSPSVASRRSAVSCVVGGPFGSALRMRLPVAKFNIDGCYSPELGRRVAISSACDRTAAANHQRRPTYRQPQRDPDAMDTDAVTVGEVSDSTNWRDERRGMTDSERKKHQ